MAEDLSLDLVEIQPNVDHICQNDIKILNIIKCHIKKNFKRSLCLPRLISHGGAVRRDHFAT